MLHDNHLMQFVPLIPSEFDPAPWSGFPAVELAWQGRAHPAWPGRAIHALHFQGHAWGPALGEAVMAALRARLEVDFLVLETAAPGGRMAASGFLSVLEGLLELTHGTGVKLALRPAPGAAGELVRTLREVRGEAVGFCWDPGVAGDLEAISDRLFCAVAGPGDDLAGLQALGYRWNLAVPAEDPGTARAALAALAAAWPTVYFPSALAAPPDPAVRVPERR